MFGGELNRSTEIHGPIRIALLDSGARINDFVKKTGRSFGWSVEWFDSADTYFESLRLCANKKSSLQEAVIFSRGSKGVVGISDLIGKAALPEHLHMPALVCLQSGTSGAVEPLNGANITVMDIEDPAVLSSLFNAVNRSVTKRFEANIRVNQGRGEIDEPIRWLPGMSVLAVDDSDVNLEVVQHILEKAGARVHTADNGQMAFELLANDPKGYDIVLMDVQMPIMDGLQAAAKIRQSPQIASVPIIALTAGALKDERQRALNAGMNEFVSKPVDPSHLIRTMRTVYERATGQSFPTESRETSRHLQQWPPITGIDVASAANRLDHDFDLFSQILRRLVREFAPITSQPLPAEITNAQKQEYAALMHRLKGSAGMLDATEVYPLAAALEQDFLGNIGSEELQREWLGLGRAIARIDLAPLATSIEITPTPINPASSLSSPEAGQVCGELRALLEKHDLDALTYFNEHVRTISTAVGPQVASQIKALLDDLEFSAVLELLTMEPI